MFERPPNGFFVRDLMVFNHLRRGGYVSNDAILAEVNSQRFATTQIMVQARTLSAALMQFQSALQQTQTNLQQTAALRATVGEMKQRLAALEAAQSQQPPFATATTTNEPADPLSP